MAAAWLALSVIPGANGAAYAQQADLLEVPVPFSWSLKPAGLDTGDRFRLLFITDGEIRANTEGFENYDGHARNAIAGGHTDIRNYARHFRAVVSTSGTDARDHIGATGNGVLIHWLNGHRAAGNYPDFFDSVLTETPKDETGRNSSGGNYWTGSNDDGTKYDGQWVGSPTVRYGNLNSGLDRAGGSFIDSTRLLGISPVFRVFPDGVPYVAGLTISSTPERRRSYETGETIKVTVTFSEAVTVDSTGGTPRLALTIGADTRNAAYSAAESTSTALVFAYTVVDRDYDDNGISIVSRALRKNGASIKRSATQTDADPVVPGFADRAEHRVNYSGNPDLVLSAASLEVPEGGNAEYTVKLATRPAGPVTVTLGGTADTDLSLDKASLTFTAKTWSTAQAVRVGADNDNDDDGADDTATLTHSASGGGYGGVSETLPVTVKDDDKPDLIVSVASLDLSEGRGMHYTVRLAARPRGPVTVALSSPPETDLSFDENPLMFSELDWDRARTVTVTVNEDDDRTDDTETVMHAASGGGYDGVSKEIPVKVSDNDTLNPDPNGWFARFGRSVAFQAVEMIASRMESGGGSRMRIAGQPIGGAGDRFEAEKGLVVVDSFAQPEPADRARTMTERSLLLGSSFQFSAEGKDGAPALSAWGRAVGGGFKASGNGPGSRAT